MLRLLREYGGGAVIAHQNMYCPELDDDTRNAISTNTSIKYCTSPEGQDLNYMARDLRCESDFLKSMHKSDTHANFACFVRGICQHPFIVESEFGWIDKWPKMSDVENREMRAMNKAALADTHTVPRIEDKEWQEYWDYIDDEDTQEGPTEAGASRGEQVRQAKAEQPLEAEQSSDPKKPARPQVKSDPKAPPQTRPAETKPTDPTDAGDAASEW